MLSKVDWVLDRSPAGVCDPDADDLDLQTARPKGFTTRCCEPVAHKVEQFACEPRNEQGIDTAVRL
jgi:hypothetical protein